VKFEYDMNKSAANKRKHGMDFEEIQELWRDPDMLVVPARTMDEERFLGVGMVAGKVWAVIFTYRGDAIRIISARRARQKEISYYEHQNQSR
tara:strand:- start:779 stop:1054 length:276 start_codon:yes stop_codon:yes gene_type:complete